MLTRKSSQQISRRSNLFKLLYHSSNTYNQEYIILLIQDSDVFQLLVVNKELYIASWSCQQSLFREAVLFIAFGKDRQSHRRRLG